MSRLGAIFAGGLGRRFGGDKAAAQVDGVTLLDRVAARLRPQCDALVVVGRERPGFRSIADVPRPGMGPLGALAGALAWALSEGHDDVLTSGCDLPDLPPDLAAGLAPAPAVVAGQPLLGLWPASLAAPLAAYIERGGDLAMRGWIAAAGARRVRFDAAIANINTPADLAAFRERRGDLR